MAKDLKINISAEDKASKVMKRLTGNIEGIKRAIVPLTSDIKNNAQSLTAMGLAYKKPIAQTKILESRIDKLRSRLRRIKPAFTRGFSGIKGILGGITNAVFSLKGAFVGFLAVIGAGAIVKGLIETTSEFENLQIQLNALQGSSEGGRIAMSWVKDFAKTTPLSLQGVTEAFVTMRAFGLDPMSGQMLKLVDASSKLGGGQERLTSIVRAVGQMFTKNKIQAEEMNRQLTEVGVPAWDLLSKKMGLSVEVLQDMSAKGKLGRKEILLLIDAIGEFGDGAALANMQTFTGLFTNFIDQVSQTKDEFTKAKAGLFDFVKAGLSEGIAMLDKFRKSGDLKKWGADLGLVLLDISESMIQLTRNIKDMIDGFLLVGKVANFFNPIRVGLAFTAGMKRIARTMRGELGDAFDDVNEKSKKAASVVDESIDRIRKNLLAIKNAPEAPTLGGDTGPKGPTDADILGMDLKSEARRRFEAELVNRTQSQVAFNESSAEFQRLANETKAEIERAHLQQLFEMNQESANRRIELEEGTAERLRSIEAQKIENSRRTNSINISGAQGLGVALAQIAGASNKKIFAINKVFAVASILIDTQAAAAKAMATILPPANFAVAAQIEADGFRRAAFAGAIGLAQGISGGGGSSGGGGGNGPGAAPNFQQQQNQGSTINLTINAVDSKSFLDNVDQVLEPIAEKLADHIGANGSSGQFNFVLERS